MVGIDGVGVMPEEQNYEEDFVEPTQSEKFSTTQEKTEIAAEDILSEENLTDESSAHTALVYGGDSLAQEEFAAVESTEIYSASEPEEYNEDFLSNMNSSSEPEAETIIPEDDAKDPLGVQRFDRAEASQLVDGPYYYDLFINGLDTSEIKDEVLQALTDKRFQWTAEEIKRKLRNGRLIFKDLNPVKAVLIVIKLQHIDVEIEWIQKLHTDPSVSGGVPGQA